MIPECVVAVLLLLSVCYPGLNAMGNLEPVLWRFNVDGTLDGSFGAGGLVVRGDSARALGPVDGHALDATERILVLGSSYTLKP